MCFRFMDFAPSYHKCLLSGGARFASLSAFSPGAPPAPPSAGAAAVVLLRRHFSGVSRAEAGGPPLPEISPMVRLHRIMLMDRSCPLGLPCPHVLGSRGTLDSLGASI